MAEIHVEEVVITLSRLVKNRTKVSGTLITEELISTLEQVASELVGEGVVVEIQKAE